MNCLSWNEEPLKLRIMMRFFSFSSALWIFTTCLHTLYIAPASVVTGTCKDADEQQVQPRCR